jgi:urease accessory protein
MTQTTDPAKLLRLFAWLSPAFPTGAFAYSHGLEWAAEAGEIADRASLALWLSDVLANGSGRSDTILLRHAHRNAADPEALGGIAELALASTPARERREEALNQGRAFLLAVRAWDGSSVSSLLPATAPAARSNLPYAVAVGAVAGLHAIPEGATACAYLQAFTANLISAAVRLVPLGQSTGLGVLAALEPLVISVADATRDATLDDIGGCAFRSELAAMRHETQYTRLFRS